MLASLMKYYSARFFIFLVTTLCLLLEHKNLIEAKVIYSFSDIAERSIPGVVNIRTKTYVRKEAALDLYQFFLNGRVPNSGATTSLGSGVIISSKGYIVTNYHVIKDANKIDVLFAHNKLMAQAVVVGSDSKTDIALLKVKVKHKLTPLSWGNSNALKIGDLVLAIGNPFGYSHTVTSGIISAMGRVIGTGPYDNFLQTDATIHPGNSGGPLLDVRGRVIGINTAVSAQGAGIGFAIPINLVKTVVRDLISHGKVKRPWIGIVGKNILSREDIKQSLNKQTYGVIVANIIINGPAHRGGFRIGDLIISMDGKKVHDLNMLQRLLSKKSPGERVQFEIYRLQSGFIFLSLNLEEVPKVNDLPKDVDLF